MLLNYGVKRRLLRVPWTARRTNQSILKEISPEFSSAGLMLKLKLQYFGHLMWRADSLEKTLMLGKIEGRRRRGHQRVRWLDGITDSMGWVWVNCRSWWWTGRPGVLRSMGSQTVRYDWVTELNWLPPFLQGEAETSVLRPLVVWLSFRDEVLEICLAALPSRKAGFSTAGLSEWAVSWRLQRSSPSAGFRLGWSEVTENHLSNSVPEDIGPCARVLVSGWEGEVGVLTFMCTWWLTAPAFGALLSPATGPGVPSPETLCLSLHCFPRQEDFSLTLGRGGATCLTLQSRRGDTSRATS